MEPGFWRFMRPAMIGPGLLILVGLLFYGIAAGTKYSRDALRANPVATLAEVVSTEVLPPATRDGRATYRTTLRLPDGERTVIAVRSISMETHRRLSGQSQVEIIQQADNPINFAFAWEYDAEGTAADPRWIGAGPLVVALILLGVSIYGRLPAWRASSGGDRYDATISAHESGGRRGRSRRAVWAGRNGKPQYTDWGSRRRPLPPVGTVLEVAIDPETGREFRV